MITVKNKCSLCDKKDLLCKQDFISVQIQKSFFSINKKLFSKNDADELQLCVTCTYQVELSSEIVREYDEMCNRNNLPSNKKCFFCEDKASHLISLNENPNEVLQKINVFLNAVNVKRDYNNLKACLRCLYNLHVWTELRRRLFKKTHILEADTLTNNNGRRAIKSSPADITGSKSLPKTNTRKNLREKSQKNLQIQHESISSTSSEEKLEDVTNNVNKRSSPKTVATRNRRGGSNNKKSNWHNYLKGKLKKFKTIEELVKKENLTLSDSKIENDPKFFNNQPFVKILVSSQISKDQLLRKTETDTVIVISDVEETPSEQKKLRRRVNLSLKKSTPSKPKGKRKPMKLKLKFPFKPTPSKEKSSPSTSKDSDSTGNASDVEDSEGSIQQLSSDDQEDEDLMCNVCDKKFTVRCDYLSHKLKHEKMEELVINVARHCLPEQLNITQLSPKKQLQRMFTSPEMINRLLSKWIGDHAVKSFEDIDGGDASETVDEQEEDAGEKREEGSRKVAENDEENVQKEIDSTTSGNEELEAMEEDVESEHHDERVEEESVVKSPENRSEKEDEEKIEERKVESPENRSEKEDEEKIEERKVKSPENRSEKEDEENIEERNDSVEEINESNEVKGDTDVIEGESDATTSVDKNGDKIEEEDSKEGSADEINESFEEKSNAINADLDNEITSSEQSSAERLQEAETTDTNEGGVSESPRNEREIASVKDESSEENNGTNTVKDDDSSKQKESDEESKSGKDEDVNAKTIDEEDPEESKNDPDQEGDVINTVEVSDHEKESTDDQVKTDKPEQIDEFSNSENVSSPVMTCEDLLNILENIDSETETSDQSSPTNPSKKNKKRKRTVDEEEQTPKRKKVRFAEEKEVYTGGATGMQVEKLVVNDQVVEESEDNNEEVTVEIDD